MFYKIFKYFFKHKKSRELEKSLRSKTEFILKLADKIFMKKADKIFRQMKHFVAR